MRGALLPLPQHAFMAWCLVKQRDFTLTGKAEAKIAVTFILTNPG
jgi:hypothetical protein